MLSHEPSVVLVHLRGQALHREADLPLQLGATDDLHKRKLRNPLLELGQPSIGIAALVTANA